MKIAEVRPGKYIVAVSGGVDSMVLLDMLAKQPGIELVVAHFEHGIRADSRADLHLVEAAAAERDLRFVFAHGNLGPGASELAAREARYAFLRQVAAEYRATAIATAHHQDDVLETAIINMMRGTGRKGLASLQSGADLLRPLLHITKQEIQDYAAAHDITWHEDSTNSDERYLRNYIRQHVIARLGTAARQKLLNHIAKAAEDNQQIDQLLLDDIAAHTSDGGLRRSWFVSLPHDVACESMAAWLRAAGVRDFDRKLIERLVVGAKVAAAGKTFDLNAGYLLKVDRTILRLSPRHSS